MSHPIEKIRDAAQRMHRWATGRGEPYMSIPADPERDADLILSAAIDELEALRADRHALAERVRDACIDAKFDGRQMMDIDLAPLLEVPK